MSNETLYCWVTAVYMLVTLIILIALYHDLVYTSVSSFKGGRVAVGSEKSRKTVAPQPAPVKAVVKQVPVKATTKDARPIQQVTMLETTREARPIVQVPMFENTR